MMLIGQQQPLEIAAKVLKPETIEAVQRSPSFNYQGLKILDRWAFNSPEKLRALEAEDGKFTPIGLMIRLLDQQIIEREILTSPASLDQLQNGMVEHEILAMHEVQTEL